MERSARATVTAVLAAGLQARLKSTGFKKDALTFTAEDPARSRVVQVRVHWPASLPDGRLVLDLGVILPTLERSFPFSVRVLPRWTLRTSVGRPNPRGADLSWPVQRGVDVARLGAEVLERFVSRAEPWFERCTSVESVHRALEADPHFAHMDDQLLPVAIALECDDRASAQRRLAHAIEGVLAERERRAMPRDPFGSAVLTRGARMAQAHALAWPWAP